MICTEKNLVKKHNWIIINFTKKCVGCQKVNFGTLCVTLYKGGFVILTRNKEKSEITGTVEKGSEVMQS